MLVHRRRLLQIPPINRKVDSVVVGKLYAWRDGGGISEVRVAGGERRVWIVQSGHRNICMGETEGEVTGWIAAVAGCHSVENLGAYYVASKSV